MSRDREGRAYTISQHGFFRRGYVLSDVSRVLDIPEDHLRRAMDSLQIPVLDSFYDDAISEDAVKEIVPNHIEPRRPHKQVIDDWHEYCRMRTFQNFLGMWMFMIREQCERGAGLERDRR